MQTLGTIQKGSVFEQRERKYSNRWSAGGRGRGQKTLRKHFYCILFVFITFFFHTIFTFFCFPDRNSFLFFSTTSLLQNENHSTCFPCKLDFIVKNSFALSIIVVEKIVVRFRVRIEPSFNFFVVVALLC